MTHQPKPSYGGDLTYSRGAAETAADFAKVGRGHRWGSFPASLPRNVRPWPDEEAPPMRPGLKKDDSPKDDDC
jgi:hypothetical protein